MYSFETLSRCSYAIWQRTAAHGDITREVQEGGVEWPG